MRFHDRATAAFGILCVVVSLGCRSKSTEGKRPNAAPSSAPSVSASPVASSSAPASAPVDGPAQLDPTALPEVHAHCAAVGRGKVRRVLPASERKPLLEAARTAWDEDSMAPIGCVEQVSISCAPDLDGDGKAEIVGEIRYLAGTEECTAARRRGLSSTYALLAFVPPGPDAAAWRLLGLIGYSRFDVRGVESPAMSKLTGFVRLPDGRAALRVERANDGADCAGQRTVDLLGASDGGLQQVATKELRACNAP